MLDMEEKGPLLRLQLRNMRPQKSKGGRVLTLPPFSSVRASGRRLLRAAQPEL